MPAAAPSAATDSKGPAGSATGIDPWRVRIDLPLSTWKLKTRLYGERSDLLMPPVSLALDTPDLAETYERVSAERQFRAGQRLIEELDVTIGETVLDVGSGTGLVAEYVADLVGPNGSVVGIDPLPLRIALAERKSRP